jgi:hypothetical protein
MAVLYPLEAIPLHLAAFYLSPEPEQGRWIESGVYRHSGIFREGVPLQQLAKPFYQGQRVRRRKLADQADAVLCPVRDRVQLHNRVGKIPRGMVFHRLRDVMDERPDGTLFGSIRVIDPDEDP